MKIKNNINKKQSLNIDIKTALTIDIGTIKYGVCVFALNENEPFKVLHSATNYLTKGSDKTWGHRMRLFHKQLTEIKSTYNIKYVAFEKPHLVQGGNGRPTIRGKAARLLGIIGVIYLVFDKHPFYEINSNAWFSKLFKTFRQKPSDVKKAISVETAKELINADANYKMKDDEADAINIAHYIYSFGDDFKKYKVN